MAIKSWEEVLKPYNEAFNEHMQSVIGAHRAITESIYDGVMDRQELVQEGKVKESDILNDVIQAHQSAQVHLASMSVAFLALEALIHGCCIGSIDKDTKSKILELGFTKLHIGYGLMQLASDKLQMIALVVQRTAIGL